MDNFSYVIWDTELKTAAVIDPAWQPGTIEEFLRKEKIILTLLLLTHAHPDHVNAWQRKLFYGRWVREIRSIPAWPKWKKNCTTV